MNTIKKDPATLAEIENHLAAWEALTAEYRALLAVLKGEPPAPAWPQAVIAYRANRDRDPKIFVCIGKPAATPGALRHQLELLHWTNTDPRSSARYDFEVVPLARAEQRKAELRAELAARLGA